MPEHLTSGPRVAVVVGNPKPESRTLAAATHLARELAGRDADLVVDLATYGGELLDWKNPEVDQVVAQVGAADLVVVACPTYKATYTGLLKLFLDRFAVGQLAGGEPREVHRVGAVDDVSERGWWMACGA